MPCCPGQVLLDPADASGEVTSAIDWYSPSPDGRLIAFGTSTGGDERSTLRIFDVPAGALLSAELPHTRAASVRSEEHTSEIQSLLRISYAVSCLKKKKN